MNPISSKPVITTIIPTYRRPKLLQRAIHSVLNQTYPHFQVCIYDNASGDETAAIVAEIAKGDSRVKYHCHPRNIGSIPNFIFGMKQVTTPYFSLLGDDNTLLPHFFEDAINILNRYSEAILFAGRTNLVNEKGQKVEVSLRRWEPGLIYPPDCLLHILERSFPTWESVLFRSEVLNSIGTLNPAFGGSVDKDFMMRIARKHTFYVSKQPYALFLYHNSRLDGKRDINEIISTGKKIFEQWLQDEGLPYAMKERIRKAWKDFVKRAICNYVNNNCIFGENPKGIVIATKLLKKEIGFCFKPFRVIIVAKVANHNRLAKRLVTTCVRWSHKLKNKFYLLKS